MTRWSRKGSIKYDKTCNDLALFFFFYFFSRQRFRWETTKVGERNLHKNNGICVCAGLCVLLKKVKLQKKQDQEKTDLSE